MYDPCRYRRHHHRVWASLIRYEYSLRHLYGLEGKRKAYSSQPCARIASLGWGGSGEGGYGHGCPFHSNLTLPDGGCGGGSKAAGAAGGGCADDTSVRGMLAAQNLPAVDIEDIVGPLGSGGGGGGALGACKRHYAATHRWAAAGGGGGWRTGGTGSQEASPNGWLAASTRSSQQPPQQLQSAAARAARAAGPGEFLTQQDQGV